MKRVSITQLSMFLRCRQEHHYNYGLRCRPARLPRELKFGQLVHAGLEAWMPERSWEACCAALRSFKGEIYPFDTAAAEAMLLGHHRRWKDEPMEILAVERRFETSRPGYILQGVIDAVVQLPDRRIMILEHKTTAEDVSPGSLYWQLRNSEPQVSAYYDGARSLGFKVDGCIYNVLSKPTLRPRLATPEASRKYKKDGTLYKNQRLTDEDTSEFATRVLDTQRDDDFQRREIVRLEHELEAARREMGRWVEAMELGEVFRTPGACQRFGKRPCPYLDICPGLPGDTDSRFTFKPLKGEHNGTFGQSNDRTAAKAMEGGDLWD